MKKMLFVLAVSASFLAACGSSNEAEQEKKDSIAAAATADSLLNATLAADSAKVDSAKIDTVKAK